MIEQTIGFLGTGRMATALAAGFVRAGLVTADRIAGSDPNAMARDQFVESVPGSHVSTDNLAVARSSNIVWIAVKPPQVPGVLAGIRDGLDSQTLLISIAAGIPLATLDRHAGTAVRTVRAMPNTPCLVGQSATAYALGPRATDADGPLIDRFFSAVGRAFQVDESYLDAVTGLSGSGPAFVYAMVEALTQGGVTMGLPRALAAELAAQTVLGAAEMILKTGKEPSLLRDQVTSPGGTTAAGLAVLDLAGFQHAVVDAVAHATRRSQELGKMQTEP